MPASTRLLLALLTTVVTAVPGVSQEAARRHPPLVAAATTKCLSCHNELLQGEGSRHGPVEAEMCESCHEIEIGPDGTSVRLAEAEPALCLTCHSDLEEAAEYEVAAPHAPVGDSCLGCHDPHSASEERLLTAAVPELCSSCHDLADLGASHAGQMSAGVDCRSCHNPHGSEVEHLMAGTHLHAPFAEQACDACHRPPFAGRIRLVARNEALCTACHGDFDDDAGQTGSVHAAIHAGAGQRGCLSCHYPHVSENPKLLVKGSPTLCGDCHAGIVEAATAATGHPPAGEDCLGCHLPHASEQTTLLVMPKEELCVMCHDVEDDALIRTHLQADLATLDCTSCHTPHGSGNQKLLAQHVHPPVVEDCAICHEGSSSELMEDGESALCLICHEDVGELAAQASVPHGALELARCVDCHNPHASKQEHLVKAPGAGPCVDCHDEQVPGEEEFGHGAIEVVGCRACHEPHGSENPALLRQIGNELCLGCHDSRRPSAKDGVVTLADRFEVTEAVAGSIRRVILDGSRERGHPIPNHPVAGKSDVHSRVESTFDDELSCLACHDPHKGTSQRMLRWGAGSTAEACLACHPK